MDAFIANPVRVLAARIIEVGEQNPVTHRFDLVLENGTTFEAGEDMLARYMPVPGDFLVTQEDGYTYVNPREVFERKYRPEGSRVSFAAPDREIAGFLRDVADRVLADGEKVEAAVVVYGTYGGKFYTHSTESGIGTLGMLDIGKRVMQDAIVRPLPQGSDNG